MIKAFIAILMLSSAVSAEPRYDQITWLCSHNAMNSSDDGWRFANQKHTIAAQLDNGVHALMLDIWKQDGQLVLRHGPEMARFLGSKKFSIELKTLHDFLTKHPDSVITLILESKVPAAEVAREISQAGLARFCHFQDPTKPWPTLTAMRASGKRLVVFSDRVARGKAVPKWYMPVWDHAWETNWQAKNTADLLAAKARRGKRSNRLFILNHFITTGLPKIEHAKVANAAPFLQQRVDLAVKTFQRKPNFLVLDFYHLGDGFNVVKRLNATAPLVKQ
ncbi:hypothetical protein JIN77_14720 [Verrucomicrobiaceae bacterium R5-34]|nr:hypothetical protein [Verrucomicrobiaceae bacterium R5-34]